ncbi:heavy-metal-associated domain-containing protein [Mangrovibacterium sp.]|uniref:heavy-metal-associated domain-containing protein n=1 Tax=Mangrovibacterium sp. TaxID=1961364 RepID=UPI0035623E28
MKIKLFLFIVGLALLAACGQSAKQTTESNAPETNAEPVEMIYHVEGMTCDHCEQSIQKAVSELSGISLVEANHEDSTTKVIYDPSQTDTEAIEAAIEKRGYTVTLPE